MQGLLSDIRFAVRVLRKARISTAAAILILAIGIGANTSVFTLLDRLLLAPLPVPNPSQLQLVSCRGFASRPDGSRTDISCRYDAYAYLRDRTQGLSGLAAMGGGSPGERRGKEKIAQPAVVTSVSGNFFDVLGMPAARGRVLTASDDSVSSAPVAVASYRFWARRYNQAADVLGRVVYLNNLPFTIVGVLPKGSTGMHKGFDPDLYIPLGTLPLVFDWDPLNSIQPEIFGRLRPGVSPAQARLNLQASLEEYLKTAPPPPGGRSRMQVAGARIELEDGSRGVAGASGEKKRSLLLVSGVVALLLILSCFNVACLLIARGAARQQEFAVRLALGAGKARILRQSMLESCMLGLTGGIAGLFTAFWGTRLLLVAFHWESRRIDISPDWRVLAFGLGISLVTGVLFGLAPAISWMGAGVSLNQACAPRFGSGKALVMLEVALSLMMVAGASVFLRSFQNLRSVPVGFSPEKVAALELSSNNESEATAPFREAELLAESLRGAPRVEAATVANVLTFHDGRIGFTLTVPEFPDQPRREPYLMQVDGEYFAALRIPLVAGQTFRPVDDQHAPRVAILSEGTARRIFGTQNPLGRRILIGGPRNPKPEDEAQIIGIVKDIKFTNVTAASPDVVFVPLLQKQNLGAFTATAKLQVRSPLPLPGVEALVRDRIREQHLPVTVESVTTLEAAIGTSMADDRLRMQASNLLASVALLLITAGIYGLMAYSVARRTREIGIRMAVGSKPGSIVGLVVKESLRLVLAGVMIGIPGAIAILRAVGGMLFGLPAIDGVSLGAAAVILCLTGIAASTVPAWRAARLDPVRALRVE